jgi:hypothetical protein
VGVGRSIKYLNCDACSALFNEKFEEAFEAFTPLRVSEG